MVWYVAITLYFLGAVIGVWGITLLRRVGRGRGMGRGRQRQDGSVAVGVRQPRRVLAGAVGVICVPLGIALVVVGDSARRGFEGWDGIPSKAWGIGATVVCLIFGAVLVYAGVRFDPAAGRRRCPRCWYDMGGTTGMRCTECGRAAKSERRLRRTRRCKRLVAAGLLLGVTPFVVRTAEVAVKDGWRAAVPTTALIVAFPYLPDDMVSNSQWSLAARLGSGRASAWQKSLFQNTDALREILRKEMWGEDPKSAAAAAEALVMLTPDRASLIDEITQLLNERPEMDANVLSLLAEHEDCRTEQLASLLEQLLAVDNVARQCAAATACGHYGPLGRRFLPALLALEEKGGAWLHTCARGAIARILQLNLRPEEEDPVCKYPR